jgi:large subunit ribosomal protein L19
MFLVLILLANEQQVPENKRREMTLKGIVLGRHNAGINTTFRLRRLVSGVRVESVFPL